MVKQLRDYPVEQSKDQLEPTPMLEQELSFETLNAIKAIVSEEPEQACPDDTQVAIVEAISAHPDFEAVKREVAPIEGKITADATSEDQPIKPLVLTSAHKVQTLQEPTMPEIEMDLVRQTVAESAIEEPAIEIPRGPEEEIIKPPSVFLRLKRHIRKKLRMHFLILKMKIRDRLPTKREVLRAMTPRRIAIAVIIAAILLEPWFLPTVLVLAAFFGSLILLAMGPDRSRHYGGLIWKRYKRKNPEKAKDISVRVEAMFEAWQSKLDRLPSRWTQGLHLPQAQSEEEKYAAEVAYASRMSRIARDETKKSYS